MDTAFKTSVDWIQEAAIAKNMATYGKYYHSHKKTLTILIH